jgi:hypothetical protein
MNDHGYVSFVVVMATQNTWFNHDYDKRNISMIIHYHTEYLSHLWLRQTEHIHDHLNQVFCVVMNDHGYVSFVVVMLEPSILCGNEWSWICSVCRSHGWTKYSVSFITTQNIWFNHDYDKGNIHDHSLPHIILGSSMTKTNETYPPSILCGNEWSWICFVCRSHAWTKYSVW